MSGWGKAGVAFCALLAAACLALSAMSAVTGEMGYAALNLVCAAICCFNTWSVYDSATSITETKKQIKRLRGDA